MKAVYINRTGGTDALAYGNRPELEISPGEFLLRVHASAMNHLDLNLRAGNCRRFPHILGGDMAGEVAQISPAAGIDLNLKVGAGYCWTTASSVAAIIFANTASLATIGW